jgi:hypothetical protein
VLFDNTSPPGNLLIPRFLLAKRGDDGLCKILLQAGSAGSGGDSLVKGETLADTAMNLEAMAPDLIVMRHSYSGSCHFLARICRAGIINADPNVDGYVVYLVGCLWGDISETIAASGKKIPFRTVKIGIRGQIV